MNDYELNGTICPVCGHEETRWRHCSNFCTDGYIEDFDYSDSLYRRVNVIPCAECRGTSIEVWCSSCGTNISGIQVSEESYCYETETA
jgi:hypothetical protein